MLFIIFSCFCAHHDASSVIIIPFHVAAAYVCQQASDCGEVDRVLFVLFENLMHTIPADSKMLIGGDDMDYFTVKEMGEKWGLSGRRVTYYCEAERIEGALKKGNLWLVPMDAEKPADGRTKSNRQRREAENDETYFIG